MNKALYYTTLSVSVLAVFFIILFSSLFSYVFNLNYYDKEYQKYNIYDRFTKEQAINATQNIMGFFNSKNVLDSNFFNENEISHLTDVKTIIDNTRLFYIVSLILFWGIQVYYFFFKKKYFMSFFSRMLLVSGLFSILLLSLFGILYFTSGFDFLFSKFHQLFFTGNYSFNPAISNMKALFPDSFFSDMATSIYLTTLLKASLLSVSGYLFIKKFR
jgi:integral membrane protein (TIGR01906 family)